MADRLLLDRETFHLDIPADENNLSKVRDFISDICAMAGFSKRETNNTKLAVDEACTNIIKHAYSKTGGDIRIDVQAESGSVEINIFDSGEPFEWSKVKDPDLRKYVEIGKKGGLGIYLMNRLMDRIEYIAGENGNHLFMVKNVAEAAVGRRPVFFPIRRRWTSSLRFKFGLRAAFGLLGMMIFLWAIQYANQTREVEAHRSQAWITMSNFARTIETKSENALIMDDLYHPEYRKITDFILDGMEKLPHVLYACVVNMDGVIVSSNIIEEFYERYEIPREAVELADGGTWRDVQDDKWGLIKEFHFPVNLSSSEQQQVVTLGRVILGVSRDRLESHIIDPRPRTALILAGIYVIGVSLIYLLISVLVKPIQALTDGVRAIGEGSLDDEIQIEGPEEFGAIARAFNDITQKFRAAQKSVVEQERFQKEMQVAQEIQHSLLPSNVPDVSGYDIASLYRAAKEVGGDYYDFVKVNEDTMGVVVADVSGKGVPGSLVMTMIRTALRMEARGNLSAAEVMSRMNDFVTEDMKKGMFVTIFYVILDSKNRVISYSSAGHNPMILFRAETDETFFLNPRGFPVGISLPDNTLFRRSIDVEKVKMKKDDMLVIYTDGVTEAMNEQRDQYGEERLIRVIKRYGRLSPQEFIDHLNEDIKIFTGGYAQNDDITVVSIKERLMADDVLFGIRKRLLDLVEIDGYSVAEACKMMKVSPSTYYRYKRRLSEMGERGLKNKELREEHEIRRVSFEQRKRLLEIIKNNPRFGAKRIANVYNEGRNGKNRLTSSLIYDELKRLRMNTFEKRLDYLRRNRFISDDEYELLFREPARKVRFETAEASGAGPAESPVQPWTTEPAPEMPAAGEVQPLHSFETADSEVRNVEIGFEELDGGIVVLRGKGHIDSSSAGELEGYLDDVFEKEYRKIIVDLRDVSYISSGGWGTFTGRVNELRKSGGDVVLAGMSPEVYDIYELLGFQEIIMYFHGIEDAAGYLNLPFEDRQKQLAVLSMAKIETGGEERLAAAAGSPAGPDESSEVWTPLTIEAGTVGEHGEITILYLNGVIDTVSCVKLCSIMDDLSNKGANRLVIDMSRVEYVSSSGWGVFASRIDEIRAHDGDIKIFGMDPEVDNIFHLLGFDVIMRSFIVLADAIDDFKTQAPRPADRRFIKREKTEPVAGTHGLVQEREIATGLDLEISREEATGKAVRVIRLRGALDASTTEELDDVMRDGIEENAAFCIVDLSGVVYISSSGWGVIVKYMQKLSGMGGKLVVAGMSQTIFKIFRDLGFEPLIQYFVSVDRALQSVSDAVRVELAPADAARTVKDRKESQMPRVEKTGVVPLRPVVPQKDEEKVIILDLEKKRDLKQDKDRRLRELGWKRYGKRLFDRKRDSNKGNV